MRALFISLLTLTCFIFNIAVAKADDCFDNAGATYNIAPPILRAIAATESRHNPMALNWNRDGSFDVGIMQINSKWYRYFGKTRWMRLGEPCENIFAGAEILSRCIAQHGYTWNAIGCYHSPTKALQQKYIAAIFKQIKVNKNATAQ